MRRVALASAALAFCLPAKWVAGASAAVACLTAATGRRLGASARLGVAIVASATCLDSTLSQELPHALARGMAHATRSNARLASRKCDRPRSRQSTACYRSTATNAAPATHGRLSLYNKLYNKIALYIALQRRRFVPRRM
ncbi:hypothetical protein EMIHUDRAFT_252450 [Emiliania huxleyi CCMP1516]|uniref:Secreted protein n=2 Tax=Emiliania huxleyi TaxID=2903 RepID=A0A0D3KK19_EMIH1|nr:hypothetical protein EMIHUDRAFT_252450 [Emiliania huxleyi CCMP1516]EOD36104.1 hypothetical protein EMIHUDRAFT_252450 [Emiliania huxleyi CCMP1516]|eukprot:XP_005788533.1 hypothetical protein EMIHUDRAFT_252450 [Emiliania huxleyi CCMP1516]